MNKIKKIKFLAFSFLFFSGIRPAKAAIVTNTNPTSLNDFLTLAINVANFILGISGSLSLLAFVYGGFLFIISRGNSENIKKAKGVLSGALIGLIIVFSSYAIIKIALSSLGIDWKGTSESPV